jgi:hypothetical protein
MHQKIKKCHQSSTMKSFEGILHLKEPKSLLHVQTNTDEFERIKATKNSSK